MRHQINVYLVSVSAHRRLSQFSSIPGRVKLWLCTLSDPPKETLSKLVWEAIFGQKRTLAQLQIEYILS